VDLSRYQEFLPYSRFSSRQQARGTSEERQDDAATSFAAAHGITLSERRVDRGKSGYHGDNLKGDGALRQIIDDIANQVIPTPCLLLIEAQDRFGRQPSTQAITNLFQNLLDKGCDLYHLGKGNLYSAEIVNRDFGAFVTLAAEIHSAHQYSELLSKRSKVAHAKSRQRIADGQLGVRPNWAPRWIDWDADTAQWKLNSYSATVLRLVELIEGGKGQLTTATALDNEGHLTPKGKGWSAGSVSHLLYSPSICGGRPLGRRTGEIAWDAFPAVIDRPRWEALKAKVAKRDAACGLHGPQDQMRWLGQGLTRCASCGRPVGYRTASCMVQGKRVARDYLRCRGRVKAGQCDQPAVRLSPVQAHLLTRLQQSDLAQLFPQQQDDKLAALRSTITQLQVELEQQQAMAAAAEQQITRLLATDPETVPIVARQVRAAEDQARMTEQQLKASQGELQQRLASGTTDLCQELQGRVQELMQTFAAGDDTPEDRRGLNQLLKRLGLTVLVDSNANKVGLQMADGPVDWQPLSAGLASSLLTKGATGQRYFDASAVLPGAEVAHDAGYTQADFDAAAAKVLKKLGLS